jgi:hypothetical protein
MAVDRCKRIQEAEEKKEKEIHEKDEATAAKYEEEDWTEGEGDENTDEETERLEKGQDDEERRGLAAFMVESGMSVAGVILPPKVREL